MAKVAIEDLSGTSTPVTSNPYDALIIACHDDPRELQERYQLHRATRNEQQKAKILGQDFDGWILDGHLVKLDGPQRDPLYEDPRNCLVFWARPPSKLRTLVEIIQEKLTDTAPGLWLMPIDNLHMTAMEVAHSLTVSEIDSLVDALRPKSEKIADLSKRARLIKPMLNYDSAALALSFVPAAGEGLIHGRTVADDHYTYHHFRRDLYAAVTEAGVNVSSRYVVPSAHMTVARFNSPNVFGGDPMDADVTLDMKKRKHWIHEVEMINDWLQNEFWPQGDLPIKAGGEWIVGEEKGLDFRRGTLWYGGGETIYLGKGFEPQIF